MKKLTIFLFSMSILLVFVTTSVAYTFNFTDPVGDQSGIVDVSEMDFIVNETTGDYTINIEADAANPFIGEFRININLFNVTQSEYFQDTNNDYNLTTPATLMTLTGTSTLIKDWIVSDIISTTSLQGLGSPEGSTIFRSSVANLPFEFMLVSEDIIGYTDRTAIPEPFTLLLLGLGLIGVTALRRKFKG